MTAAVLTGPEFELPWSSTAAEDENFRKWRKRLLIAFLLFTVLVPWLPLPEVEREELEKVPAKLAKVIITKKAPPPPPQPKVVEKESSAPKTKEKPTPKQVAAKKKVSKMGVAAFSNQLASLRSSLDVAKLQARNTNVKAGVAAKTERSMLGRTSATATSGGISTAALSANGATELGGHNSTAVDSPLGGTGGTGAGNGKAQRGSTVVGGRDMESIRRTFEQHKGAIYALYNRTLRKNPEIEGKFVFHIVIEPDGTISNINLVSSELAHESLERKLLFRIQAISFGPADAAATPVTYKFDFLPS
ncbi:MAG: AgmX/PglI C-terminal domain-containing protein [Ketobacteraceae bacterium]|nr:AgmX/PglI C-terminal domain-containing protein [Ketobacteraceae bacterium]